MIAFVHTVRLLAAAGISSLVATTALAQSSETPGATGEAEQPAAPPANADWPCEQPLRGEMSVGAMWQGPDPAAIQDDWRNAPAVVALVNEIAPRRVPQEEALANVQRFAAGYQGKDREKILTQVFVGVFDTLSAERNQIVRGIKRFYRRQEAIAHRMEEGWKMLGEIDPNATDPKLAEQRAAIQQQIDWDSRVFDDRQRLLPVVCEQPRVIEQRVFALSRAIQEQLAVTQ
jgi:hypothetical protein